MTECQCEIYEVCEICEPDLYKKLREEEDERISSRADGSD